MFSFLSPERSLLDSMYSPCRLSRGSCVLTTITTLCISPLRETGGQMPPCPTSYLSLRLHGCGTINTLLDTTLTQNVGRKDPDLLHAPRLKREHESTTWKNKSHGNQGNFFRFVFFWSVVFFWNELCFKTHIKLSYNNVVGYRKLSQRRMCFHMIGRAFYLYIMFLWPLLRFPLSKATMLIVVPNMIISCIFMSTTVKSIIY